MYQKDKDKYWEELKDSCMKYIIGFSIIAIITIIWFL